MISLNSRVTQTNSNGLRVTGDVGYGPFKIFYASGHKMGKHCLRTGKEWGLMHITLNAI